MTKRKLTIPIFLILTLSILSQTLIPSPAGADPEPWIYLDPNSTIDNPPGLSQLTVYVKTNYTGNDIWGYDFTLTYNPIILSGVSVTNGPVISTPTVVFTAGTFNNTIGRLELTEASSLNKSAPAPYPPLSNTGPGILATVIFNVVGNNGETPITLGSETKLKDVNGSNIVDGHLHPEQLGHSYFRRGPIPSHDVATTGIAMHHSIPTTTIFNVTAALIYFNATIVNQGTVPEMVDVCIYYLQGSYPTTLIEETVTVPNGDSTTVIGSLNITDVTVNRGNTSHPIIRNPVGYLTIVVEASKVYNEGVTNNNTYNVTLLIKMAGDVQGDPGPNVAIPDGDCDRYDFGTFAAKYLKNYPDPNYSPECDFNRDGLINREDFGTLAFWYGKRIYGAPLYPYL